MELAPGPQQSLLPGCPLESSFSDEENRRSKERKPRPGSRAPQARLRKDGLPLQKAKNEDQIVPVESLTSTFSHVPRRPPFGARGVQTGWRRTHRLEDPGKEGQRSEYTETWCGRQLCSAFLTVPKSRSQGTGTWLWSRYGEVPGQASRGCVRSCLCGWQAQAHTHSRQWHLYKPGHVPLKAVPNSSLSQASEGRPQPQ